MDYTLGEHELGYVEAPMIITQDDLVFDGFGLQNQNIVISTVDHDDTGDREINTFLFSGQNGGGVLSSFFRGRKITFKGTIKADSAEELNTLINEIKKGTRKQEKYLDIRVNGEVRRIKATRKKIDFAREHYHITFCPITISFEISEPFFYAYSSQSYSFLSKTGSFSEDIEHQGGAEAYPDYYFIFGAGTAITAITITNPDGTTLTSSVVLSSGDILTVNGITKAIKKNLDEIDYLGPIGEFEPGSNPISVSFTGTVLVDVTIILKKNYE